MTRTLLRSLAGIVGEPHVLTGDATAGFAVDWTGRFRGQTPVVVRPRDTAEVAAVLALCTDAGLPVVPQGGNTGLVGGGVPLHGEVVLSLTRLNQLGPVDHEAAQVTAGAGVTLRQVADADPGLDLGILIASRDSATVGGAVATNAGGLRVLRFGPMRAQLRGIEAVLADGTVVSHLAGLVKDNTGYDYPSLLAGSEGTLAVITQARLRLVPRLRGTVTALAGVGGLDELHALARRAVREVPGLVSAEFFTQAGLDILVAHAGLAPPLPTPAAAYLLLEASGPGAFGDLADVIGDREAAVGESAADRARLWSYRERHPEAAGFLGVPVKLDVSVPAAQWVRLASSAAAVVADVDPGSSGHYVRARRRRERAREHRPRGARGRAPRGRGVLLRRFPRGFHFRRARHRGAQGAVASAGAHRRGTGAVRQDPFGVRSVRHAEPERSPALIRRPGRSPAAGTGDRQGSR